MVGALVFVLFDRSTEKIARWLQPRMDPPPHPQVAPPTDTYRSGRSLVYQPRRTCSAFEAKARIHERLEEQSSSSFGPSSSKILSYFLSYNSLDGTERPRAKALAEAHFASMQRHRLDANAATQAAR